MFTARQDSSLFPSLQVQEVGTDLTTLLIAAIVRCLALCHSALPCPLLLSM